MPDRDILDLEHFLPYRLSVLSNRISQDIARLYADRFQLNVTEWRLLAVLGRYPDLTATELVERYRAKSASPVEVTYTSSRRTSPAKKESSLRKTP